MIIEIENYNGETIGTMHVREFDDGINDIDILDVDGDFDVADVDFDDIYDTNERKVRLQKNIKDYDKPDYMSLNYASCKTPEEQEVIAYQVLKDHYLKGEYYYCKVLIWNYFGHIDYGRMGYNKSHSQIISILFENLLFSIQEDNNNFVDFIDRQINKIQKWLIDGPY